MLRRTFTLAAAQAKAAAPKAAAATNPAAQKAAPKVAPTTSTVVGGTGKNGDTATDKIFLGGCVAALWAWWMFSPPIQAHH